MRSLLVAGPSFSDSATVDTLAMLCFIQALRAKPARRVTICCARVHNGKNGGHNEGHRS